MVASFIFAVIWTNLRSESSHTKKLKWDYHDSPLGKLFATRTIQRPDRSSFLSLLVNTEDADIFVAAVLCRWFTARHNIWYANFWISLLQYAKIYFNSVDTWISTNHLEGFHFFIFNDTNNDSFFNVTGKIFKDLKKVSVTFEVKVKSDQSQTYDKVKLQSNVDLCKKVNFGNYIFRFLTMNLEKYSNLRFECPMKAGQYYAYNFPAPEVSFTYIPSFMNSKFTQWQLTLVVKAKTSKAEPVTRIFLMNLRGETCLYWPSGVNNLNTWFYSSSLYLSQK